MFQQIQVIFHEGGIFMYLILAFFVATIAFIAERANVLFFKTKSLDPSVVQNLSEAISRGELDRAGQLCQQGANIGVCRVAARGLEVRALGLSDEELRSRMDETLSQEISRIDKRTGFLAMFGNVATLVGLLGTIAGMIKSFAAVASANPVERSALLSKGISEAMNCTAFGLLCAIPALVAYAVFQNRTDKLVNQMTEGASRLFHDLLFRVQTIAPKPVVGAKRSKEFQQELAQ